MVCKEDFILWFKGLKSNNRIDVMCTLLNLCLPFELRFLGTCLEDLGKRDFHDLRKTENEANNLSDITNEVQCISDKRTRPKLAFYISLLHSCNYACCNGLYKILSNFDEVNALLKSPTILAPDDNTLEELLLIYTLALNHPAFSFEQKLRLGNIFTRLQEEENKRSALNQPRSLNSSSGIDSINDKISLQSCSADDRHVLNNAVSNTSHCPAPLTSVASHLTGEPVLNLHDQLSSGSYHVRLAAYHQPPLIGNHAGWPGMMIPPEPTTSPSPIVGSRTSSPCQSNSPSRAGSPGRPKPSLSGPFPRAPPADPLRETIGKEMPNYLANLQEYSIDQLRQMCDDELRELGLPNGAVYQLRSIVNKLQATNGITNLIDIPPNNNNNNNKKKVETSEPEVPVMRRYGNILEAAPPATMMFTMAPPPLNYALTTPCLGCLTSGPRPHKSIHPNIYCLSDPMRALHLDSDCPNSLHCSNSSASDSASDHSPPDTPSLSTASDRGSLSKEQGEAWTGGDEREQRVGMPVDNLEDRRPNNSHQNSQQARVRGIGRSRSNPPGIQTLPRGRGLHPSAQRRREMGSNAINGGPDDRKVYGANEVQPFPYTPGAPAPAPPYIPHTQFIRAAAAYPAFHPNSYVRPSYPFPHPNSGEMVYQYPPPSQAAFLPPGPAPAPQPAPISYSTIVPPPKISCYNCGSQSHLPNDCQESTIEEVSKQGQYRIDYTPYQKSGECSTSNNSEK
ncbi:uncharacterized protein LOC142320667 [Lycorma delicatula]|uniref:uncharacterized protein LOC142320667 n=1 Tax=Lycorma delicatula TaxID=130591 RepID=UPI003F5169CA